jgi:hypothetical protein
MISIGCGHGSHFEQVAIVTYAPSKHRKAYRVVDHEVIINNAGIFIDGNKTWSSWTSPSQATFSLHEIHVAGDDTTVTVYLSGGSDVIVTRRFDDKANPGVGWLHVTFVDNGDLSSSPASGIIRTFML